MIFSNGYSRTPVVVSVEINAHGEAYIVIDKIPVLKITNDVEVKKTYLSDTQARHLNDLGFRVNKEDSSIRIF